MSLLYALDSNLSSSVPTLGAFYFAADGLTPPPFLFTPQIVPEFQNPSGRILAHKQQLPVSVLRHQDKAVVIVVKLRSVAVGQSESLT